MMLYMRTLYTAEGTRSSSVRSLPGGVRRRPPREDGRNCPGSVDRRPHVGPRRAQAVASSAPSVSHLASGAEHRTCLRGLDQTLHFVSSKAAPTGDGRQGSERFPEADGEWGRQYDYPAERSSIDPRSGARRRHHLDPSFLQKAAHAAIRKLGIKKHTGCHTFRHSFATHMVSHGVDIRTVQKLPGHKDLRTTQIWIHGRKLNRYAVKSPTDKLAQLMPSRSPSSQVATVVHHRSG
ncbi:MAG TPA: hypothetical protein EYH34_00645 [Planctomycetes bacterium]|nr:hypothetical protein [Planctomycetota bacterium]